MTPTEPRGGRIPLPEVLALAGYGRVTRESRGDYARGSVPIAQVQKPASHEEVAA